MTPLQLVDGGLKAGEAALPPGFLSEYVDNLLRSQRAQPKAGADAAEAGTDLLEAAAARLRGRHEFGWFWIDLTIKVGFVGTLIGFIWMLASVSQHEIIDATSMQGILKEMSFGMSTALNTTLSSLVAGILLSFPYYLLGRGLEELLETTVRLTRAEVLPRLAAATP
jgi:biopolymer transport protein ExbB/TolQ